MIASQNHLTQKTSCITIEATFAHISESSRAVQISWERTLNFILIKENKDTQDDHDAISKNGQKNWKHLLHLGGTNS